MKEYQSADIRNFAIVGHASSGKTMLSESMLACAGVINRLGIITNGTTVSDYHEGEPERQISIHASLLHLEWQGKKFNIIDTPGYLDFISEGLGALRVGDFALVVIHANHGVEVGTDKVWNYATQYGLPKMIVINAVNKENASFDRVLEQARKRFGDRVFPMTLPVNPGPGFNQVLDVLRSEIVTYQTDGAGKYQEAPATGAWEEKVKQLHQELIEHIAESDDTFLEKFFEQGGLSEEEMRSGIHAAVQKQAFIPLFCTAAESNIGVARLMDFIAKYGSSPVDRQKVKAVDVNGTEVDVSLTDPDPVLYVFKTISEAQFGELSYFPIVLRLDQSWDGPLQQLTQQHRTDRPDLHPQRQDPHSGRQSARGRSRRGRQIERYAHRQHPLSSQAQRLVAEGELPQTEHSRRVETQIQR